MNLLGYTAVAALVTGVVAVAHEFYKNRLRRRGIARLLYYRLLECQSTLAVAYYARRWWSHEDLREAFIDTDDVKRVATALRAHEWRVVNSTLGWTEHLRTRQRRVGAEHDVDPADLERIRLTYERLELARWALRRVCGQWRVSALALGRMPWDVHNQHEARSRASRERRALPQKPLRNLSKRRRNAELKDQKHDDPLPCDRCGHQHQTCTSVIEIHGCAGCNLCISAADMTAQRPAGLRRLTAVAGHVVASMLSSGTSTR
jgi:hypothetical protein